MPIHPAITGEWDRKMGPPNAAAIVTNGNWCLQAPNRLGQNANLRPAWAP